MHPDNRETYGHSLIVDPWGRVLAEQESGDGAVIAEIDSAGIAAVRERFPALANRRMAAS
jgi:predicted amidohydrolase